jgi:hypothetical protein
MAKVETDKIGTNRLSNGKFAPGNIANPNGRPVAPEREELRLALEYVKKKNNKSFLRHFVERAFINDMVAVALAKKLLPDRIEGNSELQGLRIILVKDNDKRVENKSETVSTRLPL